MSHDKDIETAQLRVLIGLLGIDTQQPIEATKTEQSCQRLRLPKWKAPALTVGQQCHSPSHSQTNAQG
jgi:hypothetical protein